MSEKSRDNDFIKSNEQVDWRDLGEYAHEILLKKGENHPLENCKTFMQYQWHDSITEDNMTLKGRNLGPESHYELEVHDGTLVSHRRRYNFNAVSNSIQVYDDNYNRLEDEEAQPQLLEAYVIERCMTSETERPATSYAGIQKFWHNAARFAIEQATTDEMVRQMSGFEEEKQKNLFQQHIVDSVVASEQFQYIPRSLVYMAMLQRAQEIRVPHSMKQLEARKEDE